MPRRCIAYPKTMTIAMLRVHLIFKPTRIVEKKNASVASKPMPKRDHLFGGSKHRNYFYYCGKLSLSSLSSFFGTTMSLLSLLLLISMVVSMPTAAALALVQSRAVAPSSSTPLSLGFLSFDLDDTLFPTHQVVEDANDVMIQHMRKVYKCPTTLQNFLATTRDIRNNDLLPVGGTHITYTDLRKRAIRQEFLLRSSCREMHNINGNHHDDDEVLDSMVNDCFQTWINERHAAAQRYLFPDVLEMLQAIKTIHFPDTCIAAITNGRGNPLDMHETLAPWFDFCVSGEDANVFPHRKPHQGIYEIAVSEYQQRYPLHSLQRRHAQNDNMNNALAASAAPTPAQQQQHQHIWCHVGDCLGNDVGASASCGAHAFWLDLESNDHYMGLLRSRRQEPEAAAAAVSSLSLLNQPLKEQQQQQQQPSWSTASQSDLTQRTQRANQVKETIAYTRITSLSELPNAIHKLLLQSSDGGATAASGITR